MTTPTPEKSVEEIVEANQCDAGDVVTGWVVQSEEAIRLLQAERQKREGLVENAMWNLNARIEEADFARKVGEKTGNAEAVYEVQDVIRQIKALTQPNNPK